MTWHTYKISSIGTGWENLKTVKTTLSDLVNKPTFSSTDDVDATGVQSFLSAWLSAKDAARTAGWDGDHRCDPIVIWLPNDAEFSYGFVLKQDDNGTTYVISPVAMPWLSPVTSPSY